MFGTFVTLLKPRLHHLNYDSIRFDFCTASACPTVRDTPLDFSMASLADKKNPRSNVTKFSFQRFLPSSHLAKNLFFIPPCRSILY